MRRITLAPLNDDAHVTGFDELDDAAKVKYSQAELAATYDELTAILDRLAALRTDASDPDGDIRIQLGPDGRLLSLVHPRVGAGQAHPSRLSRRSSTICLLEPMSLLKNPGRPAADGWLKSCRPASRSRSRLGLRSDHPPVRAAAARATSRGRWGQDRGRAADRRTGPAAPQHLGHRAADRPHRRRPRVHHRDVRFGSAIACYRVCYLPADHADEHGRNAVPRARCRAEDAVEPARAVPPGVLRPPRRGARRGSGSRAQAVGAPRAQPLGAFGIGERRRIAADVGAPPRRP